MVDIARALLDSGCDPDSIIWSNGQFQVAAGVSRIISGLPKARRAIQIAAHRGDIPTIQLLLSYGANRQLRTTDSAWHGPRGSLIVDLPAISAACCILNENTALDVVKTFVLDGERFHYTEPA
jgi:hypothetical protein